MQTTRILMRVGRYKRSLNGARPCQLLAAESGARPILSWQPHHSVALGFFPARRWRRASAITLACDGTGALRVAVRKPRRALRSLWHAWKECVVTRGEAAQRVRATGRVMRVFSFIATRETRSDGCLNGCVFSPLACAAGWRNEW